MGYNTTLFLLNDATDAIDRDPAGWWDKAKQSMSKAFRNEPYREREFGHGNNANGFAAISNEHADVTVLIAVGGNHATVLDKAYNGGIHHDEESQIELLRGWAAKLGYRIVKR